ncbi:hypothetical protein BV898_07621 [Hypsibius exemplaris]|uniref:Uncharacterized protein n=1 Tax=Hypsibius exemplaris TaxID=2072580 RepID=A0A1W0WT83_HYPEX|nr:hypothetical protein BV898_07621 [Hypsibius exemplaris]
MGRLFSSCWGDPKIVILFVCAVVLILPSVVSRRIGGAAEDSPVDTAEDADNPVLRSDPSSGSRQRYSDRTYGSSAATGTGSNRRSSSYSSFGSSYERSQPSRYTDTAYGSSYQTARPYTRSPNSESYRTYQRTTSRYSSSRYDDRSDSSWSSSQFGRSDASEGSSNSRRTGSGGNARSSIFSDTRSSYAEDYRATIPSYSNNRYQYATTTKKPSSFGSIFSSLKGLLGSPAKAGSGTSNAQRFGSAEGSPLYAGESSAGMGTSAGSGSSNGGLSGTFSKYSKYIGPAMKYGGKLAGMLYKKFGSSKDKPITTAGGLGAIAGLGTAQAYGPSDETLSSVSDRDRGTQRLLDHPPSVRDGVSDRYDSSSSDSRRPPAVRDALVSDAPTYVPYTMAPTTRRPVTSRESAANINDSSVDPCVLMRWNRELPFTEIPRMTIGFLANDSVSGDSIAAKSQFLKEFFSMTRAAFGTGDPSFDAFAVPNDTNWEVCQLRSPGRRSQSSDFTFVPGPAAGSTKCLIATRMKIEIAECGQNIRSTEPEEAVEIVYTAIDRISDLYTNDSAESSNVFRDLVRASALCSAVPSIETCLNFALSAEDFWSLKNPVAIFSNEEVCRRFLQPNKQRCLDAAKSLPERNACGLRELTTIIAFARQFFLCASV